jgi:prepilin-type N-terminal cleavage/methylation domain-containing protein
MKPHPTRRHPGHRAGFNLVELLVVLVIIAVLAALVIPVTKNLRSKADFSHCVSNMKSWGNAIALYAADNQGRIECRDWNSIGRENPSAYIPYLSGDGTHQSGFRDLAKMRVCPALKGKDAISGNGNSLTAYAITDASGVVSNNQKAASYSLASIQNPSRFVLMIEAANVRTPATIRTPSDYETMVRPLTMKPRIRHGHGQVNALMADMSVRTYDWTEISKNITRWTTF